MDETQLLKDCRAGNVRAQKQLYEMYASKMYGVCLRYAQDSIMAEDFLQEGFIKVFTRLHSFRHEGSLEGWIRRIMINTSLELLRKKDLLKQSTNLDDAENIHDEVSEVNYEMSITELLNMIKTLPAGYRAVFNLYAVEGYSHKEISEILSISEGTSKSQYARARSWLQKRLKMCERQI